MSHDRVLISILDTIVVLWWIWPYIFYLRASLRRRELAENIRVRGQELQKQWSENIVQHIAKLHVLKDATFGLIVSASIIVFLGERSGPYILLLLYGVIMYVLIQLTTLRVTYGVQRE